MNIEWRVKQTIYTDYNGMVGAVMQNKPLMKIVSSELPGSIDGAHAVCLNGKWFAPAPPPLAESLEYDWHDAINPNYAPWSK